MKRVGDICNVRLIDSYSEGKIAKVVDEQSNIRGILKVKGNLKVRQDGTVKVWVIHVNKSTGEYTFGNSYFGKYSISENISKRYVATLEKLLGYSKGKILPDDISLLKGMVNRCIKKDQWDWYTTYSFLGYPSFRIMSCFVNDAARVRKYLIAGIYEPLNLFISDYQYMLVGIYSHLSRDIEIDDERIDIPILGFEKELWDKLLYDSRKNIILVELLSKRISKYLLMHYFVTLEQEFQNNFIVPFQEKYASQIKSFRVNDPQWETTHNVLCGKAHFSLGAVYYLGKICRTNRVLASEAVDCFVHFLGDKRSVFVNLCNTISTKKICSHTLRELRNGLAHGNVNIIKKINSSAFQELHNFLFISPENILKKILVFSMNNAK